MSSDECQNAPLILQNVQYWFVQYLYRNVQYLYRSDGDCYSNYTAVMCMFPGGRSAKDHIEYKGYKSKNFTFPKKIVFF